MRRDDPTPTLRASDQSASPTAKNTAFSAAAQEPERTTLYKVKEDYLLREIAGEYVLVPVGSGAEQFNGMLTLNETFQFLWKQFQQPHTIRDVVQIVQQTYDGEPEAITADVQAFVAESLRYGLLEKEE